MCNKGQQEQIQRFKTELIGTRFDEEKLFGRTLLKITGRADFGFGPRRLVMLVVPHVRLRFSACATRPTRLDLRGSTYAARLKLEPLAMVFK